MPRDFPIYDTPSEVVCFQCGAPVGKQINTGFPPGYGEWKQTCVNCGIFTYYDLHKEVPHDSREQI